MMIQHMIYLVFLILIHSIQLTICANSDTEYYRYLQQFGYTPKTEAGRVFSLSDRPVYEEGIKTFQKFFNLRETGEIDDETKKMMGRPRCGNPDLGTVSSIGNPLNIDAPSSSSSDKGRSKNVSVPARYKISGTWGKKNLKWYIEEYPKLQKEITSHDQIHKIMKQAFHDWEKFSGLKFQMATKKEEADLKIRFASRSHNDSLPFDGPGSMLAHSNDPPGGLIHFDDDEFYTTDYTPNPNKHVLRLLAAHEIGHALGLHHVNDMDSLMYPLYQSFKENYVISIDDQQGIQSLYGKPDDTRQPGLPPIKPPQSPDILPNNNWCAGEFQTGCEGPDGELYLFKDDQVWRYQARKKRSWDSQPTLIKERFPVFNGTTITACVKSTTGYTYLFRNYELWKLKTHWIGDGPHTLHGRNYLQNPRIALAHNNSIYLIRRRLAYHFPEYDFNRDLEIHRIHTILHPPPNDPIQSGFTHAKRHYIFTNDQVYVYNSTTGNLLSGYPKPEITDWFACEKAIQAPSLQKKPTARYRENHEREQHHRDYYPTPPSPPRRHPPNKYHHREHNNYYD